MLRALGWVKLGRGWVRCTVFSLSLAYGYRVFSFFLCSFFSLQTEHRTTKPFHWATRYIPLAFGFRLTKYGKQPGVEKGGSFFFICFDTRLLKGPGPGTGRKWHRVLLQTPRLPPRLHVVPFSQRGRGVSGTQQRQWGPDGSNMNMA